MSLGDFHLSQEGAAGIPSIEDLVNGVTQFVKRILELDATVARSKEACRNFEAGILARIGVGDGDVDAAPVYRPASDADHAANRRLVSRLRQHAPALQAIYPAAKFLASFRDVAKPLATKIEKLTQQCVSLDGDKQLSLGFKAVQAVLTASPRKSRRLLLNAASLSMSLHSMSLPALRDKIAAIDAHVVTLCIRRTKTLSEILGGLSAVGKQVHGFGKNITLTSKLLKRNTIPRLAERLEPTFQVNCANLQKQYASKLRFVFVFLRTASLAAIATVVLPWTCWL